LLRIPAEVFEASARVPQTRLAAAAWAISDAAFDVRRAIAAARDAAEPVEEPVLLGPSSLLERILSGAKHPVVSDLALVRTAYDVARNTVSRVTAGRFDRIVAGVDLVCGLNSPWGEICSVSNPKFPGFVALGVNGPPALLAEQLLHEAVHVCFAAQAVLNRELHTLLRHDVGALSPFTGSVRTVERLVHGILSYGAVLGFWKALSTSRKAAKDLEVSQDRAEEICANRIAALEGRVGLGLLSLREATGSDVEAAVFEVSDKQFNGALSQIAFHDREQVLKAFDAAGAIEDLSCIQRAEVLLASSGHKVSRISIPMRSAASVGYSLMRSAGVVASSTAIKPLLDERIDSFSNIVAEERHILDAPENFEVHLFVAREASLARRAALLDRLDKAGECLGIPKCCCRQFEARWPTVQRDGGDLFADMLRSHCASGDIEVAQECDASAMYRGGGLCWHFPCSPKCEQTIGLVRQRHSHLQATDPKLLTSLEQAYATSITLDPSGRDHGRSAAEGNLVSNGHVIFTIQRSRHA
jgi:hypothetical protein